MAYSVALPYSIFVPRPVPLLPAVDGNDFDAQTGDDFYPDYWAL